MEAMTAHWGAIALSFVLSIMVLHAGPLMPGEAIGFACCCILVIHVAAGVVAICLRRATLRSCFILFAISFFPSGVEGVLRFKNAIRLKYQAPYDRFRDNLVSPIPDSLSRARFIPLEESIHSRGVIIRFDIAPADLDAILKELKLNRVAPEQLPNPQDFFRFPYYLPLDGDSQLFQGSNGRGTVLTIKTNASHTHAIVRCEPSDFYREKAWENELEIQKRMDREKLDEAKRKYDRR